MNYYNKVVLEIDEVSNLHDSLKKYHIILSLLCLRILYFVYSTLFFYINGHVCVLYQLELTLLISCYVCLQRTKPKGLIDLSCAYLYQVHDSVFDRPNCFQLVERALPCLATITYLSANTQDSAQVIHFIISYSNRKDVAI